jgi:hypothetical protein
MDIPSRSEPPMPRHDIADWPAEVASPDTIANAVREVRHAVEYCVNLGHDIMSIDQNRVIRWNARGHVQHGAVFRQAK